MSKANESTVVVLEKKFPKEGSKGETKREFPINQANQLLNFPNPQWKLSDSKFSWNGKEITASESKTKEVAPKDEANEPVKK